MVVAVVVLVVVVVVVLCSRRVLFRPDFSANIVNVCFENPRERIVFCVTTTDRYNNISLLLSGEFEI